MINVGTVVAIGIVILVIVTVTRTAKIVPQKSAFIVERLGKYAKTLDAGFHLLVPFIDRVAYKHSLKEIAVDVPPQNCITKDNIAVEVDGVLYMQVIDPVKASYGIHSYMFASTQLAQTTMRSEMGKLELDRTFEERELINSQIIQAVDKASDPWGVKITRYEIKNILPPKTVTDALEKQMRAEREKRAAIAESEGHRQANINVAQGERQQAIELSEGEKMKRINEAEGRAREIELVAWDNGHGYAFRIVAQQEARKHSMLKGELQAQVYGLLEGAQVSYSQASIGRSNLTLSVWPKALPVVCLWALSSLVAKL